MKESMFAIQLKVFNESKMIIYRKHVYTNLQRPLLYERFIKHGKTTNSF